MCNRHDWFIGNANTENLKKYVRLFSNLKIRFDLFWFFSTQDTFFQPCHSLTHTRTHTHAHAQAATAPVSLMPLGHCGRGATSSNG